MSIVYDSYILCKIRTSIKILVPKKTTIWRLKKSQSNDKLFEKLTSSTHHMGWKTFIEGSYIYNIHTGEVFCSWFFGRFVSRFDSDGNKIWSELWSVRVFFAFIEKRQPNKYYIWEVNLISYIYVLSLMGESVNLVWKIAV